MATRTILYILVSLNFVAINTDNSPSSDKEEWQPHANWNVSPSSNLPFASKRETRANNVDPIKPIDLPSNGLPPLILDASDTNDRANMLYEDDSLNQCVPIHEPICQGLQYTHTRFPNPVGLTGQDEAAKRMNDYRALISVGCSHYLKFFLCTVYFPMCTPQLNSLTTLQPCENLCRYVQSKCEPIMKSFSFPWPKELNCNTLPKSTAMCIQPQNYDLDQHSSHQQSASLLGQGLSGVGPETIAELIPDLTHLFHSSRQDKLPPRNRDRDNTDATLSASSQSSTRSEVFYDKRGTEAKVKKCRASELALLTEKASSVTKNATCANQCHAHVFYRAAEKQFSDIWLLVWSVLCALSCSLTLVTFILDRARFAYPERPIVYISACYLFYSLGFALRLGLGRDRVACRDYVTTNPSAVAMLMPPDNGVAKLPLISSSSMHAVPLRESYLIVSGYEGTWCTVVFILLYYFGQASYLWWLMLSVTWFLSAACKWGSEGIENISSVLHMLAWALPALKTMIVLIMHRIDADELTGLCHIGYQDAVSLLIFVIIPQIFYLLVGLCFLVLGFFSLFSVRSNLKHHAASLLVSNRGPQPQGQNSSSGTSIFPTHLTALQNGNVRRLDKLMAKICIFSILYIIPTVCVIGVNIYRYGNLSNWQQSLDRLEQHPGCLTVHGTNWAQVDRCLEGVQFPSVEAIMLQMFMSLVVGITSGMWVWCNRKTFTSWTVCVRAKTQQKVALNNLTAAGAFGDGVKIPETRIRREKAVGRAQRDKTGRSSGINKHSSNLLNANKLQSQLPPSAGGLSSGASSNEQPISFTQRPNQYGLNFGQAPVAFCPSTNWTTNHGTLSMPRGHLTEPHSEVYPVNAS